MSEKIISVWKGKNDTYWCLVQYWIGTGYQYIERQMDKNTYELWT